MIVKIIQRAREIFNADLKLNATLDYFFESYTNMNDEALEGFCLLDDYDVMVTATRVGGEPSFGKQTGEMDASGRFTIEDLVPGDYEVTVQATNADAPDNSSKPATAKQRVTVMKDSEANVSLTIELPTKKGKGK